MSGLVALALSIGGLGGLATWLSFGPLAGMVTIWGIFIAWGAFFHSGGDTAALKSTIICGIFGAIMAGVAFILMGAIPLGDVLTATVWVGVTVFILVYASKVPALATIPVAVYGYAATAAYAIHVGGSTSAADLTNPVVVISLSMIAGAVFGLVSGKLAGALTSE